jgi:hypothetical protein
MDNNIIQTIAEVGTMIVAILAIVAQIKQSRKSTIFSIIDRYIKYQDSFLVNGIKDKDKNELTFIGYDAYKELAFDYLTPSKIIPECKTELFQESNLQKAYEFIYRFQGSQLYQLFDIMYLTYREIKSSSIFEYIRFPLWNTYNLKINAENPPIIALESGYLLDYFRALVPTYLKFILAVFYIHERNEKCRELLSNSGLGLYRKGIFDNYFGENLELKQFVESRLEDLDK